MLLSHALLSSILATTALASPVASPEPQGLGDLVKGTGLGNVLGPLQPVVSGLGGVVTGLGTTVEAVGALVACLGKGLQGTDLLDVLNGICGIKLSLGDLLSGLQNGAAELLPLLGKLGATPAQIGEALKGGASGLTTLLSQLGGSPAAAADAAKSGSSAIESLFGRLGATPAQIAEATRRGAPGYEALIAQLGVTPSQLAAALQALNLGRPALVPGFGANSTSYNATGRAPVPAPLSATLPAPLSAAVPAPKLPVPSPVAGLTASLGLSPPKSTLTARLRV